MTKQKLISMMLCGCALLGFNSCLNSDDDSLPDLTPDEKYAAFMQIAGNHSGKIIYPAKNEADAKDVTDTLDCSFYFGSDYDTENMKTVYTLTIENVPISAIAQNMALGEQRDAMKEANNIRLSCDIDFYNTGSSALVAWLVNPITPTVNLTYGGNTHEIQIPFFVNSNYSRGAYGTVSTTDGKTKKQIQIMIMAGAIYADGKETNWLNQYTQFFIEADAY